MPRLSFGRFKITSEALKAPDLYRFDRVLTALLWLGLVVHAVLVPVFLLLGLDGLVVAGVASLLVWIASLWLCHHQPSAAFVAASIDLVTMVILTVQQIGWQSGFQYTLLIVAMMAGSNPNWSMRGRMMAMTLVAIIFLALAMALGGAGRDVSVFAAQVLPDVVTHAFYLTNMAIVFVAFGVMAYFYTMAAEAVDREFRRLVHTDTLTRLDNRRSMTSRLEVAITQGKRRTDRPVSVILCDIDYFKRVNDKWGHEAGDRALQHVAQILCESVREGDAVARWGGEEFLVLLADADRWAAVAVVERMRATLSASPSDIAGEQVPLSLTFGVAEHQRHESWRELLRRADEAMMAGKRDGRDQVVLG